MFYLFFVKLSYMHLICACICYVRFRLLKCIFQFEKKHRSFWCSNSLTYSKFVAEDIFIRDFLMKRFNNSRIYDIDIERKLDFLTIIVSTLKSEVVAITNDNAFTSLHDDLFKKLKLKFDVKHMVLKFVEIEKPNIHAGVVGNFVCQQLQKRVPFRRTMKMAISKVLKENVKGVKIQISGRLDGNEIARTEWIRKGRVPLHNFVADIDYVSLHALVNFFIFYLLCFCETIIIFLFFFIEYKFNSFSHYMAF